MAATAQEKEQLLRQIEYYFCDLSFPFDDFLKSQADEAGSVPVATLAGSPRIVSMTPGLNPEERASLLSEVVPESDSVLLVGDRLKRKYPCPADDEVAPRSVYIAGLPKSSDDAELTALLLGSSKAEKFAPVLSIRRQRDLKKDRSFTGQAFVELEDEAKARALVACCNNGTVGPCSKAKILKDFFVSQAASIEAVKEKRAAREASGEPSGGAKRAREEESAPPVECKPEHRGLVVRFEGAGESADR